MRQTPGLLMPERNGEEETVVNPYDGLGQKDGKEGQNKKNV